jgi:hypothetical protein
MRIPSKSAGRQRAPPRHLDWWKQPPFERGILDLGGYRPGNAAAFRALQVSLDG